MMSNTNPEEDCPICLGEIYDKCCTLCHHNFCKVCIIKVLYPARTGDCPLCRTKIDLQSTMIVAENKAIIPPVSLTIYGSIYIQCNLKGLASYHFESPSDCYISYESSHCNIWPRLEDGSMPPKKKAFVNYAFNLEERTFTGNIHWPVPWQGDKLWCYKIIFSKDFDTIIGGNVQGYDALENGKNTYVHNFGEDLVYERLYEDHVYD